MTRFDAATAIEQKGTHNYQANFVDDWCIGSVPHGGYVTSTIQAAVEKHFATTLSKQDQPHTIALHVDFLRRTQKGPVTIQIRDVKLGRQTSTVHIALVQDDREEVVGYVTQSNISKESGHSYATDWVAHPPRPALTASTTAGLLAGTDANWAEKRQWPNANFRKAGTQVRTWFPRRGQVQQNVYDMWMCFRDPTTRWTNAYLGFAVDCFPQVLETYYFKGFDQYDPRLDEYFSAEEWKQMAHGKAPFWYPTLLLNLEVKKALPAEGVKFLGSRLQTKQIKNGRYDLELVIWDEEGDIVALSHHVCFALSAERNTAQRSTKKEKL